LNKERKQLTRPGDKFRQVFKEDWEPTEDTSIDSNPLYMNRANAALLFGKGSIGGVD
jgi:hypothetical protein